MKRNCMRANHCLAHGTAAELPNTTKISCQAPAQLLQRSNEAKADILLTSTSIFSIHKWLNLIKELNF